MHKVNQRLLPILLCLAMLASFVPMMAAADTGEVPAETEAALVETVEAVIEETEAATVETAEVIAEESKSEESAASAVIVADDLSAVEPAMAEAKHGNAPEPYIFCEAALQQETVSIGGELYSDAILFSMGYTGIAETASKGEISYNFKGKYKSLSFDVGYVKGWERDASLTVIADSEVVAAESVLFKSSAHRYTVSLNGVHQLTIRFSSDGYDKTYYAIGNIVAEPVSGVPAKNPLVCSENYTDAAYLEKNFWAVNEEFTMGGYRYANGYMAKAGYNVGYTPQLAFNFKGDYESISFDIGRQPNGGKIVDLRPAYLTIELDEKVLDGYDSREMLWNDIPLHVEVDLSGVSQMVITLHSDGYDTIWWTMGNIQVIPHGQPAVAEVKRGNAPEPYVFCEADLQQDTVSMGKELYGDAILFSMGYTGHSATASKGEINYNFKGKYKSLSFDAGYVKGHHRDAALTVIADGEVVMAAESVQFENIAKRYTVSLEGVSQLTIQFYSDGYDKTYYAIGNIVATPVSGVPANDPLVCSKNYTAAVDQENNFWAVDEEFTMGGYRYANGYMVKAGYNVGYTPQLDFDFKGEYKKISFDLGRQPNGKKITDLRSAYLTIELDGKVLKDYDSREMLWNDIPLHVEVDLSDVSKMVIKLHSDGYDTIWWTMGNIQIKDIHTHVELPAKAATCTETGLTAGEKCSKCGKILIAQESISELDHKEEPVAQVDPTCGKDGATAGTRCSICKAVLNGMEPIPATGKHKYDNSNDAVCNVCGFKREVAVKTVAVYRLYNPYTQEHLLTGGVEERDALISVGWSLDGVAWEAPVEGISVYRLYNPYDDWHTYTTSESERDTMVAAGWTVDGVVSFGYTGKDGRSIYRLFNPYVQTNYHLFTAGTDERDLLVNAGWILEGTAWYSVK